MTLPPDRLAERVLRQFGAQVQSMTRPNFATTSDRRMVSALQSLTFATAPRATGVVGLCMASRIDVEFDGAAAGANEAGTAVRLRDVQAARVYKVVGEIEANAEVSETRQAEEERRCANAGPVIEADYDDNGRPHFFAFRGSPDPLTALLVLQRAIGEARAGRALEIRCVAGAQDCRAQLGGLDLANLDHVDIGPLGAERNHYRIGAILMVEGGHCRSYRSVVIEAELTDFGQGAEPIRRLGGIDISEFGICG